MGKNKIRIFSDLDPSAFTREIRDSIDDAKQGFRSAVRAWDQEMTIDIPVGPPHKKKAEEPNPYHPGLLQESKTLDFDESETHIEATISVGQTEGFPEVDYVRYVSARNGVNIFKGVQEAEESIEQALLHGRSDDL